MANFVNTTLMDGYAGGPHITEKQSGLANQAIIGEADYVLEGGQNAKAQVLTNNSIRIFDAVYSIQGRRDVIAANDYTDVTIANGSQGMNRNDIIVRRYRKNSSSEIESTEYAVIKGTPSTGAATDPSVTVGDIRTGAVLHEMKLYRVRLDGLNIVSVDQLFTVLPSMATINKDLANTSDKIAVKSYKQADMHLQSFYNVSAFSAYKVGREVHFNVSLDPKSGTTLLANKLYSITSAAIATDLRPAVLTHIQCVGCGQNWENVCAVMAYVDVNGMIYFSTPATRAFYKFHGIWIAAN